MAKGFHDIVIIQVMPKVPIAPEAESEPNAEAAVAGIDGRQERDRKVDPKGNYSDAEILEWMRLELTHEGTAMKSGLSTSLKSFFIISPCYQVHHGGYN